MIESEYQGENPFDVSKPERLNLVGDFADELLQQAHALNEDFLEQAQFQFAENLGL